MANVESPSPSPDFRANRKGTVKTKNYGNIDLNVIQEDEKEQSSIKKEISRGDLEFSSERRQTNQDDDTELRIHKESISLEKSSELSPGSKQAHLYAAGKQANQWKLHF